MSYMGPELYVNMNDGSFSHADTFEQIDDENNSSQIDSFNRLNDSEAELTYSEQEPEELLDIPLWEIKAFYRINELICWLIPSKGSISKREIIIEFIKGILSKCLGARIFPVGAMMSKSFLPDEALQITPFLCKGQEDSWFIRVNESLCGPQNNASKSPYTVVERVSFYPSEVKIAVDISGVSVDISPNKLPSLYLSALLEDFNTQIGSDNLFKRSLLLLKAWLTYEAPRYVTEFYSDPIYSKTAMGSILPTDAITVIMMSIFQTGIISTSNNNPPSSPKSTSSSTSPIRHPMQALQQFFKSFLTIDWESIAISACGLLRLEEIIDISSDLIMTAHNNPFAMKTAVLLETYRMRYLNTIFASQRCRDDVEEVIELDDSPNVEIRNNDSKEWSKESYNYDSPSTPGTPTPGGGGGNPYKGDRERGGGSSTPTFTFEALNELVSPYQRHCINILDPIQPMSNLCAKMDKRAVTMLELAIVRGYEALINLQKGLEEAHTIASTAAATTTTSTTTPPSPPPSEADEQTDITLLRCFFFNTFAVLTNPSRIEEETQLSDGSSSSHPPSPSSSSILSSVSTIELEYSMRHAELVLASKITADAVAHLILHVIEQRGPQPIGEIGKLLQEATGNPNLSKVLKSQFRGLKRLIEGYPNLLRLGDDHSFNPHVHLVKRPSNSGGGADPWMERPRTASPPVTITRRDSDSDVDRQLQQQQQHRLRGTSSPSSFHIIAGSATGGPAVVRQSSPYSNSNLNSNPPHRLPMSTNRLYPEMNPNHTTARKIYTDPSSTSNFNQPSNFRPAPAFRNTSPLIRHPSSSSSSSSLPSQAMFPPGLGRMHMMSMPEPPGSAGGGGGNKSNFNFQPDLSRFNRSGPSPSGFMSKQPIQNRQPPGSHHHQVGSGGGGSSSSSSQYDRHSLSQSKSGHDLLLRPSSPKDIIWDPSYDLYSNHSGSGSNSNNNNYHRTPDTYSPPTIGSPYTISPSNSRKGSPGPGLGSGFGSSNSNNSSGGGGGHIRAHSMERDPRLQHHVGYQQPHQQHNNSGDRGGGMESHSNRYINHEMSILSQLAHERTTLDAANLRFHSSSSSGPSASSNSATPGGLSFDEFRVFNQNMDNSGSYARNVGGGGSRRDSSPTINMANYHGGGGGSNSQPSQRQQLRGSPLPGGGSGGGPLNQRDESELLQHYQQYTNAAGGSGSRNHHSYSSSGSTGGGGIEEDSSILQSYGGGGGGGASGQYIEGFDYLYSGNSSNNTTTTTGAGGPGPGPHSSHSPTNNNAIWNQSKNNSNNSSHPNNNNQQQQQQPLSSSSYSPPPQQENENGEFTVFNPY